MSEALSFLGATDILEKMKNSSPKKLSADCWPTVGRQSANSCAPNILSCVPKILAVHLEIYTWWHKSSQSQKINFEPCVGIWVINYFTSCFLKIDVLRENITGVQKTLFKQDASERWEVLRNLTVFKKWQHLCPFLCALKNNNEKWWKCLWRLVVEWIMVSWEWRYSWWWHEWLVLMMILMSVGVQFIGWRSH